MKINGIQAILVAAIAGTSFAGDRGPKDLTPVTVYVLQDDPSLSGRDVVVAKTLASRMFQAAGVQILWKNRGPLAGQAEREHAIVLRVALDTPPTELPGAFAYALPYEGIHIRVFYDRIKLIPNTTHAILAHVFVHEITHILQGFGRHSEEGVMKAHWTAEDYDEMPHKPLPFTTLDTDLMRQGLAKRH